MKRLCFLSKDVKLFIVDKSTLYILLFETYLKGRDYEIFCSLLFYKTSYSITQPAGVNDIAHHYQFFSYEILKKFKMKIL